MNLLAKMRTLNKLLQKEAGHAVDFTEMSETLKNTIGANIFVVSRKGKILGYGIANPFQSLQLRQMLMEERRLTTEINRLLLLVQETCSNSDTEPGHDEIKMKIHDLFEHSYITIVPIIGGGQRLGTLVLTRTDHTFNDDDYILAEYGSTIVGMEILRGREDEIEEEARINAIIKVSIGSLSFSELEAVEHIFDELNGHDGLLVASKIADRVGITRSVIVNALRKLESAGVIETRSLGMKGTYIKILIHQIVQELKKIRV